MTHLYQHVKHSVDTSMSKIRSSKAPKIKFYELPGSIFFKTHHFNPYKKKKHRSIMASIAPSMNQSHNNGSDAEVTSSPLYSTLADRNIGYMNEFQTIKNFENQSVQELENYCVHKAEETTQTINGCMKVAEEIREVSSMTLRSVHQQGEQIIRTHSTTVTIDHELNRGEKILGSLGGVFSRTWKPKKRREIKGPTLSKGKFTDNLLLKKRNNMEQRTKLGLNSVRPRSNPGHRSSALERVEMEKRKQDDALSNLSDLLSELKAMAIGVGSEVERQNKGLDHMQDDVEELNLRVRGANLRARHLLGR